MWPVLWGSSISRAAIALLWGSMRDRQTEAAEHSYGKGLAPEQTVCPSELEAGVAPEYGSLTKQARMLFNEKYHSVKEGSKEGQR